MKIPESVKVGGLRYVVSVTPHLALGDNYNAETCFRDLRINVRPMQEEVMKRTFLHEVVHAIYDNLGYRIHDEKEVDEMAGALYALIIDNPEMFSTNSGDSDAKE